MLIMRNYKFDNIKGILIILVVFAHFIEGVSGTEYIYKFIYTFHMPLFIFVSGYFGKFNKKKLILHLIYPYVVFQIIDLCFNAIFISHKEIHLQLTKPWWLLWYLFAMIIYHLLIPLIQSKNPLYCTGILSVSIIAAFLAAYNKDIGYFLALSRTIAFAPYFIAGYYCAQSSRLKQLLNRATSLSVRYKLLAIVAFLSVAIGIYFHPLADKVLYRSYGYEAAHYRPIIRLALLVCASLMIYFFMIFVSDQKITGLSTLGKYTLPVFIFHAFIVKSVKYLCPLDFGWMTIPVAIILTFVTVLLFGNRYFARYSKFLLSGDWIEKLICTPTDHTTH